MPRTDENHNTRHKAFQLNLDPLIYGTIAEIGAGQEVARHFFRAGGASRTVAKTLSAYDMEMSDSMYGVDETGRYVTLSRLESMLEIEYADLIVKVGGSRSPDSTFFVFADTVAAKAYQSKRDCHGWMGLRFQHLPKAEPSEIVIHVRMLDRSNRDQQEALGILGVNLIHGAFTLMKSPQELVDALIDELVWGRIEIDFIRFQGPVFSSVDNLKMNIRLVTSSLSPVAMFTPKKEAGLPADLLFKKHVLVLRGVFRPFSKIHEDMIECAVRDFSRETQTSEKDIVCFFEMNMARFLSEGIDEVSDLEERVLKITGLGYNAMISSHFRYFRLSEYFTKHDKRKVGFVLSADNIATILNEKFYEGMEGGILEAMGKLFISDSKLLVYPNLTAEGQIVTAENLVVPENQKYLYRHLLDNKRIISLNAKTEKLVPFIARD